MDSFYENQKSFFVEEGQQNIIWIQRKTNLEVSDEIRNDIYLVINV